jgi:hypothetical protein
MIEMFVYLLIIAAGMGFMMFFFYMLANLLGKITDTIFGKRRE